MEKYLVTGIPIDTKTHTVLKIVFGNKTAGTNLGLFAGTDADFTVGTGGLQLSDSGGPGFQFLTIIDTHKISGKILYVRSPSRVGEAYGWLTQSAIRLRR